MTDILTHISKTKLLQVMLAVVFFLSIYPTVHAAEPNDSVTIDTLQTIPPMSHRDSLIAERARRDSIAKVHNDSVTEQLRNKKKSTNSSIDAPVRYSASDSVVVYADGTAFLHGQGNIKYKEMELESAFIRVKMDSSTVYARGVTDTISGEIKGKPKFKEGSETYESNEMTYNVKTQKGYIRHTVTKQGEGYIISERTKKAGEGNDLYMAGGRYTTCDDTENPHFYLALTKARVKPGDYIATGPAYMVVGDVPLPLAIPFGFFPFTNKYSSGLIMPSYGDDFTRGFYLRGLGYYFAINDYLDLQITGDIYTKGTWAIQATTRYVKRYKFQGNIDISYRSDVTGERDMPTYSKSTNFQLRWSHSQDSKASQYSTFSASVNFATSGYNRSDINAYYNGQLNSENTKSSSISYSQRFPDSPWSITMSGLVNQRTKDSTITLTLPELAVNMSRIYPFKRKKPVGKTRWYEKISLQYTLNSKIGVTSKESELLHTNFLRDWQTGVKQNIPISASWTLFKYLTLTPSITYTERWYFQRQNRTWDEEQNVLRTDTTNGFYRVWDFNTSLSASTKFYMFYIPIRKWFGDKVDRFRHVITPSISFNYHPDFGNSWFNYYGSYDKPYTDSDGNIQYETVTYNRYQGALYGTPSQGAQGALSFSVGNNLEMKIRNDRDTTGKQPHKIISLIDDLSLSGGYNFIADSMNWNMFRVRLRIKLPINYTLNLSGDFDPYMYGLTPSGRPVRINQLYWNHGKFPHFLGTSTSFSYTLDNNKIKGWIDKGKERHGNKVATTEEAAPKAETDTPATDPNTTNPDNMPPPITDKKRKVGNDGYEKTDIKWSITANYTIRYGQGSEFDYNKMYYKMKFTHNLSLSATLSLGKGWSMNASTSYDFDAKQFTYTNFNVRRDLHCWTMTASFVPFGPYKTYNFHIGVNASMLADLKYDKNSTQSTNARVTWW